jgi:hypothetical protein
MSCSKIDSQAIQSMGGVRVPLRAKTRARRVRFPPIADSAYVGHAPKMRAPHWLQRERRRLRRKFIKKLATRDYHTVDRWMDFEFVKAGVPVWLVIFISAVEDLPAANLWMLGALAISIPWWIFITVILLQVYGRWGDKVYMTVTRRMLSKEYRE